MSSNHFTSHVPSPQFCNRYNALVTLCDGRLVDFLNGFNDVVCAATDIHCAVEMEGQLLGMAAGGRERPRRRSHARTCIRAGDRRSARRVSNDVQNRWRAFSRTGTPGDGWPKYAREDRAVMVFDRRTHLEYDPNADRRQAWEGFTLAAH